VTLFLLDTNAVSDLLRRPAGPVAERVRLVGEDNICMSIVVSAELEYGAGKKADRTLERRIEEIRRRIPVMAFEQPADLHYGIIRARLEAKGRQIGANDLFIAAHALALGATLVTDNIREFSRVPDLPIENWLRH
jgi:tRNA(fMet)-specific endonuclease VapC